LEISDDQADEITIASLRRTIRCQEDTSLCLPPDEDKDLIIAACKRLIEYYSPPQSEWAGSMRDMEKPTDAELDQDNWLNKPDPDKSNRKLRAEAVEIPSQAQIDALFAENAKLRAVLEPFARHAHCVDQIEPSSLALWCARAVNVLAE